MGLYDFPNNRATFVGKNGNGDFGGFWGPQKNGTERDMNIKMCLEKKLQQVKENTEFNFHLKFVFQY